MTRVREFLRGFTIRRGVIYVAGIVFLACGITLNTKTQMGVSPVVSVAYILARIIGIPFSEMTFFYYCFLILVQVALLRKRFEPFQWLQLIASFLTSAFIAVFELWLPAAQSFPFRVIELLIAVLTTGIGIILTVGAQFVPNPADGTANAISLSTGLSLGWSKNLLDLVSILIALALGLLFEGTVVGIGLGTVITMLLTGRVVGVLQKPVLRFAGLEKR